MMSPVSLDTLEAGLYGGAFGLGASLGAVLRSSGFCTMGAVADAVLTGSFERARTWAAALAVAVAGFHALVAAGWLQASDSAYAAPTLAWLPTALGGLLFGIGMVLASGCAVTNLVRLGGGNLKALVVAGVLGVAAYAVQRGALVDLRVALGQAGSVSLQTGQDMASQLAWVTGWPLQRVAGGVGLAAAAALMFWVLVRPEGRAPRVWAWGCAIGALVLLAWVLSGVVGRVDEHPVSLERVFLGTRSGKMEALSFVAPTATLLGGAMWGWGQAHPWTLGASAAVGVVAGAAVHAGATGSFRWQGFAGTSDTARHLIGAVMMGVGGVLASGCTVGQGLSGASTLALGSWLALGCIVAGGVMGTHLLEHWLGQEGG